MATQTEGVIGLFVSDSHSKEEPQAGERKHGQQHQPTRIRAARFSHSIPAVRILIVIGQLKIISNGAHVLSRYLPRSRSCLLPDL